VCISFVLQKLFLITRLDGLGRAALGAVFKPVTGVLGFAAKAAEGVSQSAANALSPSERRRLPRLLYGPDRVLRTFSEAEALCASLLAQLANGSFGAEQLVALVEFRKQRMQLLLTTATVLCVHVPDQKVLWTIPWRSVRHIEFSGAWQVVIYHADAASAAAAAAGDAAAVPSAPAWQRIAFRQRDLALNCFHLLQSTWLRVHIGPQTVERRTLAIEQ
jgi:hypothetical protein